MHGGNAVQTRQNLAGRKARRLDSERNRAFVVFGVESAPISYVNTIEGILVQYNSP